MNTGPRILIAEDSVLQAETLQAFLEKHEYSVQIARNGKEGMRRLREFNPVLIISDIRMSEMDGYEFCRNVKAGFELGQNPIPFFLLTSLSDPNAVLRGLECGADHFITKPYDEESLLACIRHTLQSPSHRSTTGENPERQRILDFILPAFETAVQRNTELLRAKEELTELAKEARLALRTEVAERQLIESQFRQSQKMEAIGRLAGGIAHDFNNLLTVIQGRAQLLFDQVTDEDLRAELDLIRKTGARAARLTHQLLAFSRKQPIQVKAVDLAVLVTDAERLLTRVIGKNVNLTVRLGPNLGAVQADPSQIDQVVLNLVVNSRDAMPAGGTILIETSNADLDDAYCRQHLDAKPGRYVMLAVSDTGQGMDEETKARIFEPFFTTKGRDRGTGLGLSTVHRIVQQNGGHIWVQSEPGNGTIFKVYLPRVDAAAEVTDDTERIDVRPAETLVETVVMVGGKSAAGNAVRISAKSNT